MKQLKEYLHFYYSKQVVYLKQSDMNGRSPSKEELYYLTAKTLVEWDDNKLGLSLRHLSDMTEEEAWEVWREVESPHHRHVSNPKHVFVYGSDLPLFDAMKVTKSLLSKGFDLFGLIEDGLAIDKTKQYNHETNESNINRGG